jgi:hypothetical protein
MGLFVWDSEPSKIFVGDTPISKVFLWDTQVRPSGWAIWTYSYDFTTWSTSDLQSKGWTVPTGSVVNSNGYYNSSKNRNMLHLDSSELANVAQTATKLVMTRTWTATNRHQRTFQLVWWWAPTRMYWDGEAHSWGGGNQVWFGWVGCWDEATAYWNNWIYTNTFTVDITNKTWKYEWTNHTTETWTITDASITAFRQSSAIELYWERYAYVKSFSVTIE